MQYDHKNTQLTYSPSRLKKETKKNVSYTQSRTKRQDSNLLWDVIEQEGKTKEGGVVKTNRQHRNLTRTGLLKSMPTLSAFLFRNHTTYFPGKRYLKFILQLWKSGGCSGRLTIISGCSRGLLADWSYSYRISVHENIDIFCMTNTATFKNRSDKWKRFLMDRISKRLTWSWDRGTRALLITPAAL